jgi:hypothetical protein
MVKNLAGLWVDSLTKNQRVYVARPSSASSSCTGSTTSLALPTHRPPFGDNTLRNSTRSTSTFSNTLDDNERDGIFYLEMRPGTADSAPTTPSTKADRRSFFDEQLLTRLPSLEWQEQHKNDKKPKVGLHYFYCSCMVDGTPSGSHSAGATAGDLYATWQVTVP